MFSNDICILNRIACTGRPENTQTNAGACRHVMGGGSQDRYSRAQHTRNTSQPGYQRGTGSTTAHEGASRFAATRRIKIPCSKNATGRRERTGQRHAGQDMILNRHHSSSPESPQSTCSSSSSTPKRESAPGSLSAPSRRSCSSILASASGSFLPDSTGFWSSSS